jgi:GNAT superfamily N-acetyltransferase
LTISAKNSRARAGTPEGEEQRVESITGLPPMRARESLSAERRARDARATPSRDARTLVYRRDGDGVVGSVCVKKSGDGAVLIHDLRVEQRYRGAGLGAGLLASALQAGARMGRSLAWLEAGDDGSGKLVAWYERLGFERVGTSRRGMPIMQARIPRR